MAQKRRHRKRQWTRLRRMAARHLDYRPTHSDQDIQEIVPHDQPHPRNARVFKTPFPKALIGRSLGRGKGRFKIASSVNPFAAFFFFFFFRSSGIPGGGRRAPAFGLKVLVGYRSIIALVASRGRVGPSSGGNPLLSPVDVNLTGPVRGREEAVGLIPPCFQRNRGKVKEPALPKIVGCLEMYSVSFAWGGFKADSASRRRNCVRISRQSGNPQQRSFSLPFGLRPLFPARITQKKKKKRH